MTACQGATIGCSSSFEKPFTHEPVACCNHLNHGFSFLKASWLHQADTCTTLPVRHASPDGPVDSAGATNSASIVVNVSRCRAAIIQNAQPVANQVVQFSGWGDAGAQHVLEVSTNLVDWLPVSTNAAPNGLFEMNYQLVPGKVSEFFRVKSQP